MVSEEQARSGVADEAYQIAAQVRDPELPMLTLADLGILRGVRHVDGSVVVVITPTYSGCPALATIRSDLRLALADAGFDSVEIRTALSPAWSSDWITEHGRQVLAGHGIAPPDPITEPSASGQRSGTSALTLIMPDRVVCCPHCASGETHELSHFSSSACRALRVCHSCGEPFEHFKQL